MTQPQPTSDMREEVRKLPITFYNHDYLDGYVRKCEAKAVLSVLDQIEEEVNCLEEYREKVGEMTLKGFTVAIDAPETIILNRITALRKEWEGKL